MIEAMMLFLIHDYGKRDRQTVSQFVVQAKCSPTPIMFAALFQLLPMTLTPPLALLMIVICIFKITFINV
jgi:hypothetical protein